MTANKELNTGTRLVYKPDLAGPIFSTPFIKKIWAKNEGKIIITAKIIIPLLLGGIILPDKVSYKSPGIDPKKAT